MVCEIRCFLLDACGDIAENVGSATVSFKYDAGAPTIALDSRTAANFGKVEWIERSLIGKSLKAVAGLAAFASASLAILDHWPKITGISAQVMQIIHRVI